MSVRFNERNVIYSVYILLENPTDALSSLCTNEVLSVWHMGDSQHNVILMASYTIGSPHNA